MDDKLKVAQELLNEAQKYIKKNNTVQASEKIYKVVEECIKLLSEKNGVPEYEEAKKEGKWWTHLLGRAASNLAYKLNEPKIYESWTIAYDLHVWGFHERKYDIIMAKRGLPYAEWLFNYTKNST